MVDVLDISAACNAWTRSCCRRAVWHTQMLEADTHARCAFVRHCARKLGLCGLCRQAAGGLGLFCVACTRHRLTWGPVHGFLLAAAPQPPVPLAVAGWHAGAPLQPVYDRLELRAACDCGDSLPGNAPRITGWPVVHRRHAEHPGSSFTREINAA